MNASAVIIILAVLLFVIFDGVLMWALFGHLRSSIWNPLADRFPHRNPAPDAVRRDFQSLSVGLFNLGWMIHITVDDECLHLEPCAICRWIGLKSMSVPWDEVRPVRRSVTGWWATVRIGNTTMRGPAWCFSLAGAPEASRSAPS